MLINFYLIFSLLINPVYLENRAIKKYKKGKYKEAIKIFSNQSNNKKNAEYYFYLGHSYSLTGKNSLAITLLLFCVSNAVNVSNPVLPCCAEYIGPANSKSVPS